MLIGDTAGANTYPYIQVGGIATYKRYALLPDCIGTVFICLLCADIVLLDKGINFDFSDSLLHRLNCWPCR